MHSDHNELQARETSVVKWTEEIAEEDVTKEKLQDPPSDPQIKTFQQNSAIDCTGEKNESWVFRFFSMVLTNTTNSDFFWTVSKS
jgi:hypothetical protein